MTTVKERYEKFVNGVIAHSHDGIVSEITDYVAELEHEKAELVEFVKDIAYNDISRNDITLDWVQKTAWELLNKHTEAK
jgi:hypothetical protein